MGLSTRRAWPLAALLLLSACVVTQNTPTTQAPTTLVPFVSEAPTPSTVATEEATTAVPRPPTTTTSTVMAPSRPIDITTSGNIITGVQDGETVFTLTHSVAPYDYWDRTSEPFTSLARGQFLSGTITNVTVPDWIGIQYGDNNPIRLYILDPPDTSEQVVWLTDGQGQTSDGSPGGPRLLDEITLETQSPSIRFVLQCRSCETDIGPALISLEGVRSEILLAWDISTDSFRLERVDDPTTLASTPCP